MNVHRLGMFTFLLLPAAASAGDGSFGSRNVVGGNFDDTRGVYAADLDGDGDTDVLGAAFLADDVTWWENISPSGDGTTWTKHTIDGDFDGADTVRAVDIDGDGDFDVFGCVLYADSVAWWENVDGNGAAWTKHFIDAAFDEATALYAADVNGNGLGEGIEAAFGRFDPRLDADSAQSGGGSPTNARETESAQAKADSDLV
ncbi:MAG: VCBS repeat-containing protein [Phycisphaerae bacterium]